MTLALAAIFFSTLFSIAAFAQTACKT
jgi:hypothetical protein